MRNCCPQVNTTATITAVVSNYESRDAVADVRVGLFGTPDVETFPVPLKGPTGTAPAAAAAGGKSPLDSPRVARTWLFVGATRTNSNGEASFQTTVGLDVVNEATTSREWMYFAIVKQDTPLEEITNPGSLENLGNVTFLYWYYPAIGVVVRQLDLSSSTQGAKQGVNSAPDQASIAVVGSPETVATTKAFLFTATVYDNYRGEICIPYKLGRRSSHLTLPVKAAVTAVTTNTLVGWVVPGLSVTFALTGTGSLHVGETPGSEPTKRGGSALRQHQQVNVLTDSNGEAPVLLTTDAGGDASMAVFIDANGFNISPDPQDFPGFSVTWADPAPPPPAEALFHTLALNPRTSKARIGAQVTVTALASQATAPVQGVKVTFEATGHNSIIPGNRATVTTGANGMAKFTFTATEPGEVYVTAAAAKNTNEVVITEPSVITYTAPKHSHHRDRDYDIDEPQYYTDRPAYRPDADYRQAPYERREPSYEYRTGSTRQPYYDSGKEQLTEYRESEPREVYEHKPERKHSDPSRNNKYKYQHR